MTFITRALAERMLKVKIYNPDLPGEEWKQVPSCPEYSVSSYGRVRRDATGYEPHTNTLRGGYERVKMWNYDRYYYRYRHDLVTEAFLPQPSSEYRLHHKNGNKTDNRVENLEWISN